MNMPKIPQRGANDDEARCVIISARAEGCLMRKREARKAMTKSDFNRLIADGETVHLECKLAKNAIPANFWETYSSFANTDGGTI